MSRFLKLTIVLVAVFTLVIPPKIFVTPALAEIVDDASCAPWSGVFVSCGIATVTNLILTIATNILMMAGTTFDYAVDYSLDMSKRLDDFKFVSNGWGVLRDVTNLAYIFILLYIAINIILGNSGYQDKSLIAKVLVTAVFVNFSLFGAKVIVDATNIAALQFYNLITPATYNTSSNAVAANISKTNTSSNAKSLTSQFMNLFNLQSIFGDGEKATTNSVLTSVDSAANSSNSSGDKYSQPETWWRIAKLCVLGTMFVLAVTVVFFAGAFLFISRTVVIFFLMLFASLAVASRALPATKSQFDSWLKKLINNAIFAPIFMGLIYIFVSATNTVNGKNQLNLSKLILDGSGISGLVTFFMYLAFLVGLLLVAKQLGIKGGDAAHGIADKWISPKSILARGKGAAIGGVKMGFSGAKALGSRTLGFGATKLAESALVKGTLGRVPIVRDILAGTAAATGVQARRDAKTKKLEARHKYHSTISPQGPLETDAEYKTRGEAAEKSANEILGIDEKGKKKEGFIHTLNGILGGEVYRTHRNTVAKAAKAKATTKERAATAKAATWTGIKGLTGLDLIKMVNGAPELDSNGKPKLDEDGALKLYELLENKSPMTFTQVGANPATWGVTITSNGTPPVILNIAGPGLDNGINSAINSGSATPGSPTFSQDVTNYKVYEQKVKEILSKATTLKSILEKEASA